MTEPTSEPDERLERMLRQWGADEAGRGEASAPAEPAEPTQRKGGWPLRWLPLAAAAALLAAAMATFEAGNDTRPGGAPDLGRLRDEVSALRQELSGARERATAAEQSAATLASRLEGQKSEYEQRLAELRSRLAVAGPEKLAEARARADRLHDQLLLRQQEVQDLTGELAETQRMLADARDEARRVARLEGALADVRRRLASAVEEMERMHREQQDIRQARQALQAELQRLEIRHASLWRDFQRAYVGSGGGRIALDARQRALERHRLLLRAPGVRPLVRSAETAELVDRLEVVLTRLMMLPPGDPDAERAFDRLVEEAECIPRIEAVLAGGGEPEPVRTWLVEAKLVLMGGAYAV
jgi:hypothetical protein